MSSVDYGMYGFNVLNVNGETSDLPICTLYSSPGGSVPRNIQFSNTTDDPYKMAVQNGTGLYSYIRTPISGIYEISLSVPFNGGGAVGGSTLATYVDKCLFFDSSGIGGSAGGTNSYLLDGAVMYTDTSREAYVGRTLRVFLEKDCYVYLVSTNSYGTAPSVASNNYSYFSVRCVSAENAGKTAGQTL